MRHALSASIYDDLDLPVLCMHAWGHPGAREEKLCRHVNLMGFDREDKGEMEDVQLCMNTIDYLISQYIYVCRVPFVEFNSAKRTGK